MVPQPEPRFLVEVLHVLVHLAFADGKVTEDESQAILATGRRNALPPDEIAALEAALAGRAPLPPLDLEYLRDHRAHVLEVARIFVAGNGLVSAEVRVLTELARLLDR